MHLLKHASKAGSCFEPLEVPESLALAGEEEVNNTAAVPTFAKNEARVCSHLALKRALLLL